MTLYKAGTFTVTDHTNSQTLNLGFVPDYFYCTDITLAGTSGSSAEALWTKGMAALVTPITIITTGSGGTLTRSTVTTTGISSFTSSDIQLYTPQQAPYTTITGNRAYIESSTNLVITGISNATNASVTATHSFTSADEGVTVVTFHGVQGMTQINGLSGVIQTVTSTTSFTVNIDSTNFGTYTAGTAGVTGGFANVITGAPATTLYGNVNLPTAEANLGITGITLGTGIVGASGVSDNDVFSYVAMLQGSVT